MLYALSRANGTVAITTLVPHSLVTDTGTLEIAGVNGLGKMLLVKHPDDLDQHQEITFAMDFRDLDVDSLSEGRLVFPKIEDEMAKLPDPYVSASRITTADLPAARTFRNAWTHNGKTVVVDMAMARDIHRDKLREARAPLLAALDVAYQRADEAGDADLKKKIAAEKQALRDITGDPRIASARTADDLNKITVGG